MTCLIGLQEVACTHQKLKLRVHASNTVNLLWTCLAFLVCSTMVGTTLAMVIAGVTLMMGISQVMLIALKVVTLQMSVLEVGLY